MRDRLIELLKNRCHFDNCLSKQNVGTCDKCKIGGDMADYLLENGVIVAPMPMADWLRKELTEYVHKRCMEEL